MGHKKNPKGSAQHTSSATNPAASSNTQTANKSSILRSSFSPSRLQLSLFASVIQGLESQHLRIHETTSGRLRCEHAIASKASITCLEWGYHGEINRDRHHQESKRKRKRSGLTNGDASSANGSNSVVAFGTSDSDVHLFSPAEAKVLKTLGGAHTHGICDFKFKDSGAHGEAWSIGGDGKLVQWDVKKGRALRTLTLPYGPANTLRPLGTSVVLASQNAYVLDPDSQEQPIVFPASTQSVHTIVASTLLSLQPIRFLTSAETDRFISVFKADSTTLIGSLRTENEIMSLDSYRIPDQSDDGERVVDSSMQRLRPREAIAAVNKDGAIEIFSEPFVFDSTSSQEASKGTKARMQKRTRPRDALIRIKRPDKSSSLVPILSASFEGNEIAIAWAEGGVNLIFERIQWRDDVNGNLILEDTTDIVKGKAGPGVGAVVMNGVKDMGRSHVDDSHAVVVNGGDADDVSMADDHQEVIEISSGQDSDSEDEISPRLLEQAKAGAQENDEDVEMENIGDKQAINEGEDERPEEMEEPSFGDLIRANAPEAVDVQASFADPNAQSLVPVGDRNLQQLPSGLSLGTVLTQSLRTNDTNLLETCFHVKDLSTVRATIERLNSSFAVTLLQKLAERFHSRPGRAGSLMVWMQWTIVAHGGYLAGQPGVMKKIASLYRVVKDRGNSLQALLALKGRLDMLEAQQNLRKSMQARSKAANAFDDDEEEGVIYVEGQEESDSEDEIDEEGITHLQPRSGDSKSLDMTADEVNKSDSSEAGSDEEEGSEDGMPTTNGVVPELDDVASDSDASGLIDDEASSTDRDSMDEGSENYIDHDSVDSVDSSDADTSPPPKRPAKSKLSNGISSRKR